jgi:phosphohistidine phosphatase
VRTLLVLRHAKSSWADEATADHQRPLNDRGRRDAPRMGALLREQRVPPEVIISSDARRALLTAEAVAAAAGLAGPILPDHRLYLAAPEDIVAVVREVAPPNAATVMIVGHNPGFEDLVARLTGERHDMPTAALAQIALPIAHWRDLEVSSRGQLVAIWRPRD